MTPSPLPLLPLSDTQYHLTSSGHRHRAFWLCYRFTYTKRRCRALDGLCPNKVSQKIIRSSLMEPLMDATSNQGTKHRTPGPLLLVTHHNHETASTNARHSWLSSPYPLDVCVLLTALPYHVVLWLCSNGGHPKPFRMLSPLRLRTLLFIYIIVQEKPSVSPGFPSS